MYLRVPVHLLESQMSAVETLPDCFSHICLPLQVDEVKSITHLLLSSVTVCRSAFLLLVSLNLFYFLFKPLLFFSHSQNLYFESSLPGMIFFSFPSPPQHRPSHNPTPFDFTPSVVLTFSSSSPSLISCIHCPLRWHAHTR